MKTPRQPAWAARVSSSSSSAKLMVAWATHSFRKSALARRGRDLCAGDVVITRADEIVVNDQDVFLADGPKFPHDFRDRPLAVAGAIERGHAAEGAVQGTTACRLDRPKGVSRAQQIITGAGHRIDIGEAALIAALQAALPGVSRPAARCRRLPRSLPQSACSRASSRHMVA